MADLGNFDARTVEPESFEPLPSGKYLVIITESEMKPTKNGQGKYLQLKLQVIEGPCKNRLLWARLNLENANAKAAQIARGQLSAICRAVGVLTPRDSQELHNLPLVANVVSKPRADTGEPSNEVKGFAARQSQAMPQPQLSAPATAPWKR